MFLLIQVIFLAAAYLWLDQYRTWFFIVERALSLVAIFYLINGEMDALSRVTWLILIMIAPLLGSALLLYTRLDLGYRGLQRRVDVVTEESAQFLQTKPEILAALKSNASTTYHLVRYFEKCRGDFPAYQNTQVTYFPLGENFFEDFKKRAAKSEKIHFPRIFHH